MSFKTKPKQDHSNKADVYQVASYPESDSRHTVGESVGSLVREAACLASTDTTPPCSSESEPRPEIETLKKLTVTGHGLPTNYGKQYNRFQIFKKTHSKIL